MQPSVRVGVQAPRRALVRDAAAGVWRALSEPVEVWSAHTADELGALLARLDAPAGAGLHTLGFLSYEAAPLLNPALDSHAPGWLPLAWFARFASAVEIAPPGAGAPALPTLDWQPSIDRGRYREAFARIKAHIGAGDTYQVNFSYRLRAQLPDALADDPWPLFANMLAQQPDGFGAYLESADWAICCASPELLFERRGDALYCRPMKGTAARGAHADADAAAARWLAASLKNRAENLMITDMVRNDLGRVAQPGSVRTTSLFDLERYATLWQMTSTVRAESTRPLPEVIAALFPAASITGAPKRRTMQLIRELEDSPRQIYTGSIGYLRPDGSSQFNVAIRTALIRRSTATAEYGVGGGILWDSDSADEHAESRTKARILQRPPSFALLETLRWCADEGFLLLEEHLDRMGAAAAYFGRRWDRAAAARELDEAVAGLGAGSHRVRLLAQEDGRLSVAVEPLTALPEPFRVALACAPADVVGSPFVYHKTTCRDLYQRARASAPAADDVLLWNTRGELTESTIANLVVEHHGVLWTPPVSCGLLPGVYRGWLLREGRVRERVIHRDELTPHTPLYLANSVRGLWPVRLLAKPDVSA